MKYLTTVWNWMKDNTVGIVVGSLVFIYMMANTASIEAKAQSEKDILACKSLCFPQQSEFITHVDTAACWCYVDSSSMRKAK